VPCFSIQSKVSTHRRRDADVNKMRVIPVNIDQLQQLRGTGKSFMVVFVGTWQKRQGVALLQQLASCVGQLDLAVFQVKVGNSISIA
jgi:hypothetical protein